MSDLSSLKAAYIMYFSEYGHQLPIPKPVADYVRALEEELVKAQKEVTELKNKKWNGVEWIE
jgi:hypothetical protein